MIVSPINRQAGSSDCAGAYALSLLAIPHCSGAVQALGDGPRTLGDVCKVAGPVPETTLRGYLRELIKAGIVRTRRDRAFRSAAGYELTDCGWALRGALRLLAGWLAASPDGPIELGTEKAKHAVRTLVEGWSTDIVRTLAARPLTLAELDAVISSLTYPTLGRRLQAMRQAGLLEPVPAAGRSVPYKPTDWMRRSIVPFVAAIRWERRYLPAATAAITNRNIEAVFLMCLPLLRLPGGASGSCRLVARRTRTPARSLVGGMVELKNGSVVGCTTRLDGRPDAWAAGSISAWLAAVIEGDARHLELGGDGILATEVVEGIRSALLEPLDLRLPAGWQLAA